MPQDFKSTVTTILLLLFPIPRVAQTPVPNQPGDVDAGDQQFNGDRTEQQLHSFKIEQARRAIHSRISTTY